MSELILTSYLEDGELKVKIVKDSQEFWKKMLDKFKQKCGPKLHKSTVEKWQQEEVDFGERVLEHIAYWLIAEEHKLDYKKTWELTNKLNLHEKLSMALAYIKD